MKSLNIKCAIFNFFFPLLFCLPLFSIAQIRLLPSLDFVYTNNIPKSTNIIDCTPVTLTGNHVFNPAFNTNSTYNPANVANPFAYGHIDFWTNAFSTPNFDFVPGSPPPYPSIHAAFMGSTNSGTDIYSEGLLGKLSPLTPGIEYSLTFYLNTLNTTTNNLSHSYNIYLIHCDEAPTWFPDPNNQLLLPPIPPNSQRIFCETNTGTTNWHQESVCFIPNDDYDMILIFPAIIPTPTTPNYTNYIGFAYPEIVAKSNLINITVSTPDPNNPCIKVLSPSYTVSNATYKWYLNGNLFSTFPNPQFSTSTQFGTVTLEVTLPNGGTNSTCGLASCTLSGTINISQCAGCPQPIVTPNGPIDVYVPTDFVPLEFKLSSNIAIGNQWYYNNQPIPGAINQDIIFPSYGGSPYLNTGIYYTKVNGCISNSVSVTLKHYGYGNYGEEIHDRLGAKIHPLLTSNYYCYNTTNNFIQQFDLGPTATYTWNFDLYPNGGTPNISLTPGSYNPNSNQAQVNIGSVLPSPNYTYAQGVADLNGRQIILDYYIALSHPGYLPTTLQVCPNTNQYISNLSGSSYSTLPGGSGFDWESYDFGPNGLIFSGPGAGQSSVLIQGRSTPQQMIVRFTGPSSIQKHFYYNWGGCYKEEYNVTLLSGCKSSEELTTIASIYPNPTTNQITITSTEAINKIQISDLMSPNIKTIKVNGTKSIIVNVTDLKPGVYNCRITTGKGTENQKIIIHR